MTGPGPTAGSRPLSGPPAAARTPVGADSLRGLRSTLLREDLSSLGPHVALRWFTDPPATQFVLPSSDALAVVLVTRGTYLLESGKGPARAHALMRPGSTAVTAPGREVVAGWRSTSPDAFGSLHLHVASSLLQRTADDLLPPAAVQPDWLSRADAQLSNVMRRLAAETRAGAPRLQLDTGLQLLLHHLLRDGVRAEPKATGLPPRALRSVTDLMRARLGEALTLDELAAVVHLSPYHFLRRFRASTGETPMRWLTRMRMDHAETLLAGTALPIGLIATRSGYATASAFTAAFTRTTGRSPSRFRRSPAIEQFHDSRPVLRPFRGPGFEHPGS